MDGSYNYADDIQRLAPSAEQLKKVLDLSRLQYQLQRETTALYEELKSKLAELERVTEVDLPDAMRDADIDEQPLGGGWVAKLQVDVLAASLNAEPNEAKGQTSEQHAAAQAWMDEHHPDLLKRKIEIYFNKEETAWYNKFMADLRKRKKQVNATAKMWVHPGSLLKFVREQIAEDPQFPRDTFGAYERTWVKLVPPKGQPTWKRPKF